MRNHFLHAGHLKKRLGRSRESAVSSRQIALKTNNLPSRRLKSDFGEVDEEIFEGDERLCELIFCIMGIQKCEMDEVAEVMFQVGKLP
jgi:hypothetical protein